MSLWLILALVIVAAYVVLAYNKFVTLRNAIEAEAGQIKVALKKRLDMIEQLVEATKGSIKYEKDVLLGIAEARKAYSSGRIAEAFEKSASVLGRLMAIVENYPQLKAQENVSKLMDAIKDVENEIARHRYVYNNIVQQYNTMVEKMPSMFVAKLFGFEKKEYLRFREDVESRPKVEIYG